MPYQPWLLLRVAACLTITALCIFPHNIEWQGRLTTAAFLFCLSGFLLLPEVPNVVIVLAAVGFLGISGALKGSTDPSLFWGFAQPTTWLVVSAIHISAAVTVSGLGQRIAMLLLSKLGHSPRGVAYALCLTELCLAPFVPSNTARGGGIVAPIVEGLAKCVPRQAGYLVLVANHANLITAGTFLTGMSGNIIATTAAKNTFVGYDDSWLRWFQGSFLCGVVSLAGLPFLMSWLVPMEEDISPDLHRDEQDEDMVEESVRHHAPSTRIVATPIPRLVTRHLTSTTASGVLSCWTRSPSSA